MRNRSFLIRFGLSPMRNSPLLNGGGLFPMRNRSFLIRFGLSLMRNSPLLNGGELFLMRNRSFLIRFWPLRLRESRPSQRNPERPARRVWSSGRTLHGEKGDPKRNCLQIPFENCLFIDPLAVLYKQKDPFVSLLTKCPSPVVAPGFYLFLSWRSCRYRSSYDKRFKGPCLGCGNVRLKLCILAPGRPRLGLRDPREKVPRSCRSFCPMVIDIEVREDCRFSKRASRMPRCKAPAPSVFPTLDIIPRV